MYEYAYAYSTTRQTVYNIGLAHCYTIIKTLNRHWLKADHVTSNRNRHELHRRCTRVMGTLTILSSDWLTFKAWLCSVLHPRQHSIGYMGDGFYRSKDPTNI